MLLKKTVLNVLKSLSATEKDEVRKALADEPVVEQEVDTQTTQEVTDTAENVGEQTENSDKKGETAMEKDKTTTTTEETTKATETEGKKGGETTEVKDAKTTEQVATTETAENAGENEQPQVTDAPTNGNGVRIEDLVTKDEVQALMASFEAKFAAVVKENQDLKAKNEELVSKYETPNFGGQARQGVAPQDQSVKGANETFDEYIKRFM